MSKKLRAGDVLVGTCKEDKNKKDVFVVANSDDGKRDDGGTRIFDLVCLTREIGWQRDDGRWDNEFYGDFEELGREYTCYKFKRVKRLSEKLLNAVYITMVDREEEE